MRAGSAAPSEGPRAPEPCRATPRRAFIQPVEADRAGRATGRWHGAVEGGGRGRRCRAGAASGRIVKRGTIFMFLATSLQPRI